MMDKKGQVTAFVIVAIIIVAVVTVVILLNRGSITTRESDIDNPESYLSTCIRERAEIVLDEMFIGGGFVEPKDTVLYNTNEITYLCKNINNFEPCINQYPLYASQIEKEFKDQIKKDAEQCYAALKNELSGRNYDITDSGRVDVEVNFKPEVVEIVLLSDITISKSGESRKFSRLDTYVSSKIQSIAFVVNEILSQEAKWCYFSNDGYMILYPEYDIRVYMMEDSTKIYTIKNKKSDETLRMATRGCVLPAGWY